MACDGAMNLPTGTLSFVLRQGELSKVGLRLGELTVRGRPAILTPNLVIPTSRGVIPHVTQDALSKLTRVPAVYIGLEDFIEKTPSKAPIFRQTISSSQSKIRDFIALPNDCVSILGPRRIPAVECPSHNSNSSIAICTSVGFQSLDAEDYLQAAQLLNADVTTSIADIVTSQQISQKRLEKSADRTHAWMRDTLTARESGDTSSGLLFASIPPLEPHQQSFYLSDLCDEYRDDIAGVSLSSPETATHLPDSLQDLPRLCLTSPHNPAEVLRTVALGNDLITVPFITDTSENGIALSFSLSPPAAETQSEPLGFDLWDNAHATNLSPLLKDCECYTCTKHHRAYVHHLLSVKEMLAWTLLQVHNLRVVENFFQHIRESIEDGTFEEKSKSFRNRYDAEFPKTTGLGPRIRGYQTKSVGGGEPRKNQKVYGRLEEHAKKIEESESGVATPEEGTKAYDLQKQGMGAVQY